MSPLFRPEAARAGRYPVRIPIRMTEGERAVIGKSATSLNLSISRYLVELATRGHRPLLPEDRARLKFLSALFAAAIEKTQAALASRRLARDSHDEIVQARHCLEEALRLLEAIARELGRRLG